MLHRLRIEIIMNTMVRVVQSIVIAVVGVITEVWFEFEWCGNLFSQTCVDFILICLV